MMNPGGNISWPYLESQSSDNDVVVGMDVQESGERSLLGEEPTLTSYDDLD